jgi:hypothetical protein
MDPFDLLRPVLPTGTVAPMGRGETSVTVIPGFALDDELDRLLGSVERARHNQWLEGDLVADDQDGVLAAVTNRAPLDYSAGLPFAGGDAGRPNRWREERTVIPGVTPRS